MSAQTQYSFLSKVPNQVGYLVINEDGAVLQSSGEVQNHDRLAGIIHKMVHVANSSAICQDPIKRMTIHFDKHLYAVTVSSKKIFVVKRRNETNETSPMA